MPLGSYKRKEDLVRLARALQIANTGTVAELIERIKEHLSNNQNMAENARFSIHADSILTHNNLCHPNLATPLLFQ
jgi:hypothetical protein